MYVRISGNVSCKYNEVSIIILSNHLVLVDKIQGTRLRILHEPTNSFQNIGHQKFTQAMFIS